MSDESFLPEDSLDSTRSSQSGRRYTCTFEGCSASFGKPSRLEQHVRVHTGERPFKCEQCGLSYTRNFHLKRHINTTHEKIVSQLFRCPVNGCERQFASSQKLRNHHETIHSSSRLKCEQCSKTFTKHQQLKIHQYQHTGVLPYECEVEGCGQKFLLPSKLKAHSKTHKGYSCDAESCSEVFTVWSALRSHKAKCHPKTYTCAQCEAQFKRQTFLRNHMKAKHEPEREVFHCPVDNCTRWYYYENNLKAHVDRYHNAGEFKCTAENCTKEFKWKKDLCKHLERHKTGPKAKAKITVVRKTRSDKGKHKKPVAAILSGHPVNQEESQKLMRSVV